MAALWFGSFETREELEGKGCRAGNHRKSVRGKSLWRKPGAEHAQQKRWGRNVNNWNGMEEREKGRKVRTQKVSLSLQQLWATSGWCVEYFPAIYRILTLVCCVYKEMQTERIFRQCNTGWLHRVTYYTTEKRKFYTPLGSYQYILMFWTMTNDWITTLTPLVIIHLLRRLISSNPDDEPS